MTSLEFISEELLHSSPRTALEGLQAIVRTGDPANWYKYVPKNLDITSLTDAMGRNLLHTAVDTLTDHPPMVRALMAHTRANQSGWRDFINQQDNRGFTPRSYGARYGCKESAALIAAEGGVLTEHYDTASRYAPKIRLIARDGQVIETVSEKLPKGSDWAKPALQRLRRELAEVAAHMPELAEVNVKRGGNYAITEGQVSDFHIHVLKQNVKNAPHTIAMSKAWKEIVSERLVTIYAADPYVRYHQYVNVAAHELTHSADANITLVKRGNAYPMDIVYGKHSDKPIYKLAVELDRIIGGPKAISTIYKEFLAGSDSYRANPAHEYFALASNHLGIARPPAYSPLLAVYQDIILRPVLIAQRDDKVSLGGFLMQGIEHAKPEAALGPQISAQLNAYRAAKDGSEEQKVAATGLLVAKGEIEAKMIGYMRHVVSDAQKSYQIMWPTKPASQPVHVPVKPVQQIRAGV